MSEDGPRRVRYVLVASLVAVTLHWPSRVHETVDDRARLLRGLPYTLFNLLFGWWGLPWGPVRTLQAVAVNLAGGLTEAETCEEPP